MQLITYNKRHTDLSVFILPVSLPPHQCALCLLLQRPTETQEHVTQLPVQPLLLQIPGAYDTCIYGHGACY